MFFLSQSVQSSSRRNLFTPNTTRRAGRQSSSSFYGKPLSAARTSTDTDDEPWQPGEYLVPAQSEPPQPDIQSLLSQMQSAISTQIEKVQMSLDTLSGRVDHLEDNMSGTAEQLLLCQASLNSSSSSTDSEEPSKQRRRHIAPDKSVSISMLCLPVCTCFLPTVLEHYSSNT